MCFDHLFDLSLSVRMGSLRDNRVLYPKVLTELGRVCRAGARAVLLTHDNKTFSRVCLATPFS